MEDHLAALTQAFSDYRQDVENYQRNQKPTDGLFGFGRSLKDDPCHALFDGRVQQAVDDLCAASPTPAEAEQAVRLLLARDDISSWPVASQWMMRAVERHSLPLIPFLSSEAAAALLKEYSDRCPRWERLPTQKAVFKALKAKGKG